MARRFHPIKAVCLIAPKNSIATGFLEDMTDMFRLNLQARTAEFVEMPEILGVCADSNPRFSAYLDLGMASKKNVPDELVIPAFKKWFAMEKGRNECLRTLWITGAPLTERQCCAFRELFEPLMIIHLEPSDQHMEDNIPSDLRWQAYHRDTRPFMRRVPSMPDLRKMFLSIKMDAPLLEQAVNMRRHLLERGIDVQWKNQPPEQIPLLERQNGQLEAGRMAMA